MIKLLRNQSGQQNYRSLRVLLTRSQSSVASSMKKKAVIFDMGGVLFPTPVPLVNKFAVKHNLSRDQMDQLLFQGGDSSLWSQVECGNITVESFSEKFKQKCQQLFGEPFEDEIVARMMKDMTTVKPYPEMISAIKECRKRGLKTALLTNNFISESGQSLIPLEKNLFDVVSE